MRGGEINQCENSSTRMSLWKPVILSEQLNRTFYSGFIRGYPWIRMEFFRERRDKKAETFELAAFDSWKNV